MLEETPVHLKTVLEDAEKKLSLYFKKPTAFSKVIQLSEPDRRNVLIRLFIDKPHRDMPETIILKQNAIDQNKFDVAKSETETEQLSRFAHDWAGLEFLTEIGLSMPTLLHRKLRA